MADGDNPSQYVKLNKNQAEVEINPGELNQPIEVPQVFISGNRIVIVDRSD
ncbi:hypothetical protein HanHA300_Chr15g0576621 [Helianthus annuus]|nr:hypothetical protein HanHA300_Chr15g0576621 [Helianthus annuus]KAJ0649701.1 hypothetical protein HanLR1_Chr15g0587301 [Helianthus annuus]